MKREDAANAENLERAAARGVAHRRGGAQVRPLGELGVHVAEAEDVADLVRDRRLEVAE